MVVPHKRTRSDVLLTRSPLAIREQALYAAVRLACVKHAASVQSEPGSNSSVQSLAFAFEVTFLSLLALKILTRSSLEVLTFSCERLFLFLFLSTNVHTYHLFFFKDRFASTTSQPLIKRFVYLQQRNEIMNLFLSPVKPFFHFSQLLKK